jgi:hypothetical protein
MSPSSWNVLLMAGLALGVAPGTGSAQGLAAPDMLTPYGEYALMGGGVTDFTSRSVRDRFGTGGSWDLRLGVGSRTYLGAELAYVGAYRSGNRGFGDLLANGAEAVARVQYPYATGSWLVAPFAFGGIGWRHVSLSRAAGAGLKRDDDFGVVPFGAGVTLGYRRLFLDARFTYRAAFSEDLRLAANESAAKLSQWAAGASVGLEF